MENKFDKGLGQTRVSGVRCPKCGTECYENLKNEFYCPNCGIISGNKNLDKYLSDGSIG